MTLNSSLAEIEKGPQFRMEEAAASEGPQGELSSSRARNRRKSATPMFRRCMPGAPRAATQGVANFRR
eukprot:5523028-Alexandrium_andersonii.AAC.1